MGDFEDQLWTDLMHAHGDELARAQRPPARRGRARPLALTAGGVGVIGAITAVTLGLPATTGTPAYAVTENADGTVAVTIHDLIGIRGANAELARLGVPIRAVTFGPDCRDAFHPDPNAGTMRATFLATSPARGEMTVRPAEIPAGDTLLLTAEVNGSEVGLGIGLVRGPAPSCIRVDHRAVTPTR